MSDNNYPKDMNLTIAYMSGVEGGKALERAKIVAWLRAQNRLASLDLEQILANDIEAGEHLK
jgi:hypothetical protein